MNEIIPKYQVSSRTTLTRTIVTEIVQKATDSIHLEFDLLLNDNFTMEKHTLATNHFPESHTGKVICHKLSEIMEKLNTPHGEQTVPVYVVSDNAREPCSSWNYICFAHSLQLAENDAENSIESMKNVCSKGLAIVSYSHRSIKASSKLEHLQRQMIKPTYKLIQDIETLWNNEYLTLEHLLEHREPLSAELSSSAKVDGFSNSEWKLVSDYVQFLKPVYDAMTEMSSES
ncbi:hypothetical protein PR048_007997 [Dryococelus australis]|uniref:Uncharacterized protein n=1 Tax=Dryococelus australis TaxID=614101 RepID=A0ABQ9HVV3_9NEOP|nr:hypothetical protein PR048_007997 [Dryococelus australis]